MRGKRASGREKKPTEREEIKKDAFRNRKYIEKKQWS